MYKGELNPIRVTYGNSKPVDFKRVYGVIVVWRDNVYIKYKREKKMLTASNSLQLHINFDIKK